MIVVAALGVRSILRRGEALTADGLRGAVSQAAAAIAPVAARHRLVIALGAGPQVRLLSLQDGWTLESYSPEDSTFESEGMISYMLAHELANRLPDDREITSIATTAEVDPDDPAFASPATRVGPLFLRNEAEFFTARRGWTFQPEGHTYRRVIGNPEPKRIVELRAIASLVERNVVVIATGGPGLPTMPARQRRFSAADCAVDADLTAAVLARDLGADRLVLLTHLDGVYVKQDGPEQRRIQIASPAALDGSAMAGCCAAAKVAAACRFVRASNRSAAIGAVDDLARLLQGDAGTTITSDAEGIVFAEPTTPTRTSRHSEALQPRHDLMGELRNAVGGMGIC